MSADPWNLDAAVQAYAAGSFSSPDETAAPLAYRLLSPPAERSSSGDGSKFPLVLFLHGAGERGDDNRRQLLYFPTRMADPAVRRAYPCFVLAPQCPAEQRWVEVDWDAPQSSPLAEPTLVMKQVIGALQSIFTGGRVDRSRVYLTGLSMGGYGCWDLAMRRPEMFTALVPICGGGDETSAARLADLPTWAFHGALDPAVPVERSRRMIEAIRQAGGSPRYTELADVDHDSWTAAYSDSSGLLAWMFDQRRRT